MIVQLLPPTVLLTGDNTRQLSSLAVCLILGGSKVIVHETGNNITEASIFNIFQSYYPFNGSVNLPQQLKITGNIREAAGADLAILLTAEDPELKRSVILKLEQLLDPGALIVSNMESIQLADLQRGAIHPKRILGANWVEPIYTSCFLEIITNPVTGEDHATEFRKMAKLWWGKDPYIVTVGYSVRSRLMCAILREAFFLIENKYAGPEDIDRACRNDAGFYLAFAGNFRYMDLMGLYAYGVVMGDLNPELSQATAPPCFFTEMLKRKEYGMKSGKGFFEYMDGDSVKWETAFEKFSHKIEEIIKKYPVSYVPEQISHDAQ